MVIAGYASQNWTNLAKNGQKTGSRIEQGLSLCLIDPNQTHESHGTHTRPDSPRSKLANPSSSASRSSFFARPR